MNKLKLARPFIVAAILLFGAQPSSSIAGASEIGVDRMFGLGGMIGDPTGLSMKLYFNERHALDFGVGFDFIGGNAGSVHVDYLFHFILNRNRHFDLPLYLGVGGQVQAFFNDDFHSFFGGTQSDGRFAFAVRGPVGIAFNLNRVPIDIFIEVVPGIGFIPGDDPYGDAVLAPGFFIESAVGVRYYFGGHHRRRY